MKQVLAENPLFLLFIVAAIGYLVGKVSFRGNSLGVSAVLFVGLAIGAIDTEFNVPEIVFQLGLVFFVYSIGLSSGPAFFASFRKNGWRDIGFVMTMLTVSALVAIAIYYLFDFSSAITTGIYAGSTTNTPALASVIDVVNNGNNPDKVTAIQQLVLGYTYSYPMGVVGVMIVLKVMERIFRIDYEAEKKELAKNYPIEENLTSASIRVDNESVEGISLRDLMKKHDWKVKFGRISQEQGVRLSNWDTVLNTGDVLMVIGSKSNIRKVAQELGTKVPKSISYDREKYDVRSIFVSNPEVVGKTIASLDLNEKYSAVITRIRRGDIELLAWGDTVLELGDRVRFVARREDLRSLSALFGDSYYASAQINLFSFGLGIAIGILVGLLEFTLPGGVNFKLGLAGGPLVVGLILGALKRTGRIIWTLPYSANVTLRQLGLILLLAVIGLRSGNTFLESLDPSTAIPIFMGGVVLSMTAALLSVLIGYKLFKIPFSLLLGFLSNQPAILEFSTEMTKNRVPLIGYSLMFPLSLVMKVLYAQLLYLVL